MPSRFKSPIEVDTSDQRIKVDQGPLNDSRLDLLISFGMPDDEARVSIQWAGQYFDERFKGYSVELFGVEAEDLEPDPREWLSGIGATTPHHVALILWEAYKGELAFQKRFAFNVWMVRVREPGRRIISEETWTRQNTWLQMTQDVPYTRSDEARELLHFIEESGYQMRSAEAKKPKNKTARKIKYTPEEAQELSERILADAVPIVERMAFQKRRTGKQGKRAARDTLSIEAVASAIGRSKQTLYDVDHAERAAGRPGLIKKLKDTYRRERDSAREHERDLLKRLKPS